MEVVVMFNEMEVSASFTQGRPWFVVNKLEQLIHEVRFQHPYLNDIKLLMTQDAWSYLLEHYPRQYFATPMPGKTHHHWNWFVKLLHRIGFSKIEYRLPEPMMVYPGDELVHNCRTVMREKQAIPVAGVFYSVEFS